MDGRQLAFLAPLALAALIAAPGSAWAPQPPSGASPPPLPPPQKVEAPPAPPARTLSAKDLRCLALNVYWESRGQPLRGQAAVAHVTLNRVGAAGFPRSVCGVVYQGCQFGWTCDGRGDGPVDGPGWEEALWVARQAAAENDVTGGALFFHHVNEHPQWARGRYARRTVIGQHVFFSVTGGKEPQVADTGP
ncbi:MAG TPA: cell wall hydrolase [Magnetospirillum sp.]|nr:cell wall hydrolase [Magnetospirillum sp.]